MKELSRPGTDTSERPSGEIIEPLAVIHDYAHLRDFLRQRRRDLGLTHLALDEMAGVQSGYTGKIEAGMRHFGDVSLGSIMGALGVALVVVPATGSHAEILATTKASIEKQKKRRKILAAKGGRARVAGLTPDERRCAARHASKIRWRKWREARAEKKRRAKHQRAPAAPERQQLSCCGAHKRTPTHEANREGLRHDHRE